MQSGTVHRTPGRRVVRGRLTCDAPPVNDFGVEVDSQRAEAVVPNRPDSTPAARAFLTRLLNGWGLADTVVDDASLLTTELVSNAVRHGTGAVKLRVEVDNGVVEVRVHDDEADPPSVNHADPTSLNGRGLWIVECVADQWGSDPDDPGKSVWFRLTSSPEGEQTEV